MTRTWADGDYGAFADRMLRGLGAVLVDRLAITADERVLDIACGVGNASIPAAARGAAVTASDLTPELVERGRASGTPGIEWVVADAQDLPFPDGSFDVVMSCVGVIFAPHHDVAARELVRVCRPGGRIGLVVWRPDSQAGRMMASLAPFQPPPRPGTLPPQLWGDPDHLAGLLGDAVEGLELTAGRQAFSGFSNARELLAFFRTVQGASRALFRLHEDDPTTTAALEAAMIDSFGEAPFGSDYLLVSARRV